MHRQTVPLPNRTASARAEVKATENFQTPCGRYPSGPGMLGCRTSRLERWHQESRTSWTSSLKTVLHFGPEKKWRICVQQQNQLETQVRGPRRRTSQRPMQQFFQHRCRQRGPKQGCSIWLLLSLLLSKDLKKNLCISRKLRA